MKGEPDDYRMLWIVGIIAGAVVLLGIVAAELVAALHGVNACL